MSRFSCDALLAATRSRPRPHRPARRGWGRGRGAARPRCDVGSRTGVPRRSRSGIGQTAFGKGLEDRAVARVPGDPARRSTTAGIAPEEVDGLACSPWRRTRGRGRRNRRLRRRDLLRPGRLRRRRRAAACVGQAAMAVATGQCRRRGGVASAQASSKASRPWAQAPSRSRPQQWSRPFGLLRPVDEIALLARRYMHEYGATRDHLANVALAFRKHANRNPKRHDVRPPLSREQYMESRWISEPLCLFDNCLETDGALAVVVVPAERARDGPSTPVLHPSFAQGLPPEPHDDQLLLRRPTARAVVDLRRTAVGEQRTSAAGGRRRGAALRRLQPADAAVARGLRLLRPRRGRRSPTTGARMAGAACRSTPPAAACPRPTCTASTWSTRGAADARHVDGAGRRMPSCPGDQRRGRPHQRAAVEELMSDQRSAVSDQPSWSSGRSVSLLGRLSRERELPVHVAPTRTRTRSLRGNLRTDRVRFSSTRTCTGENRQSLGTSPCSLARPGNSRGTVAQGGVAGRHSFPVPGSRFPVSSSRFPVPSSRPIADRRYLIAES
jgi:hypothetical protein